MKKKRSRVAVVGLLALAICVTVGLVSGGAADAKTKKKGSRSFTVSNSTPTTVPGAPGPGATFVKIPIGTVGKKVAKGKVVSLNGVTVTSTFSGPAGFASSVNVVDLIGPSGRVAFVRNPIGNGSNTETSSGPLTETPNSAMDICVPDPGPPPQPPCADPDSTLGPPYIGTIGNTSLLNFSGSAAVGTWFIKVGVGGADPVTVNSVKVTGGLITKPS
jgi:hypothetical protein